MSSGKSQYLGYHSNFDVEEGYDVPEAAFQKRHHRTRQRPDGKPRLHGAHLLVRRQAKPRLLARSHSLPGEDEFAGFFSEGEPALGGADAQTGATERADWPTLLQAERGTDAGDKVVGPDSEAVAAAAGKRRGWQSFGPFLAATAPPPDSEAQKWPAAKKESVGSETPWKVVGQEAQEQKEQEEHRDAEETPDVKYKVDDEDNLLEPDIAEAASRLLPKMVQKHLEGGNSKISLGLMKLMLEDAVAVACLGTEHAKKPAEAAEGSISTEALEDGLPVLDALHDARDLRGKGWLKGHKASMGLKAAEKFAEKATRRSDQSNEYKGVTIARQGELGRSWAVHDKERSKQHGGVLRSRKWPASHAD